MDEENPLKNTPYLVVDLETSVDNHTIGSHKASPFHEDNKIVANGWKLGKWDKPLCFYDKQAWYTDLGRAKILVGHNLRFDLHYLCRDDKRWVEWVKHNRIWDTQLAEYILSGQSQMYPSLDYCAEKRGGVLKNDKIKAYWNGGVRTEDIPKVELLEYLVHDVENTELVYLSQVKEAYERGMLSLIFSQMEGLLATFEMERNGMVFDCKKAKEQEAKLEITCDLVESDILAMMESEGIEEPNANSGAHISCVLFGGSVKKDGVEPVLDEEGNVTCYKTGAKKGLIKTRKVKLEVLIKGTGFQPKEAYRTKGGVNYKVNDDALQELKTQPVYLVTGGSFIDDVLEYRKLNKDLKTYYKRSLELVWPTGLIHPNIQHCSTATGRLSQTAPNLQNYTGDDK